MGTSLGDLSLPGHQNDRGSLGCHWDRQDLLDRKDLGPIHRLDDNGNRSLGVREGPTEEGRDVTVLTLQDPGRGLGWEKREDLFPRVTGGTTTTRSSVSTGKTFR